MRHEHPRDERRKARARYLVATDYGSQAKFASDTGIKKARVSQALSEKHAFGEDAAAKWEDVLGLPQGWFNNEWPTPKEAQRRNMSIDKPYSAPVAEIADGDSAVPPGYVRLQHLSPVPTMGDGASIDEPVTVLQYVDVLEQWVRERVGTPNPARIKILTARGSSMRGTIQDQDIVFVDITQHSIDAPGIYVLDVAGRFLLKRALIQGNGTLILRSDNVDEYPDEERYDLAKYATVIHVAGRVCAWWTLRRP